MLRRWWLALALSIAAHLAVVGGIVGGLIVSGLTLGLPIDVEITGMRLDEVHDLPLGPAAAADHPAARPRPPPRKRPPLPPGDEGELAGKAARDDPAGAADEPAPDQGAPRATSLRQYGPEGSRVTVLLRLDRLRGTGYAPALDAILGRLPDRRDLLEGTGLDLFQTFDALLIATPNPLDYTVTFLAAHHRLRDGEMRAALERGAKATGRALTWRTEGRRPFAERHARAPAASPAPGFATTISRDDRLIVLPAPGLVVVTPPSYRSLLLASMKPRPAAAVPDGGSAGDAAGEVRAHGAESAAAPAPTPGAASGPDAQWGALLRRLDAQDGIMPPDAVALLSAVDIFSARSLRRGLGGPAPPAHPAAANQHGAPATPGASLPAPTILGLPVPKVLTASIGTEPSPFLDVKAEMENEDQARRWEAEWPALHQRLKTNPYVLLTGFGALVARVELSRSESEIHLRQTATEAETLRLLQLVARFLGAEPIATP